MTFALLLILLVAAPTGLRAQLARELNVSVSGGVGIGLPGHGSAQAAGPVASRARRACRAALVRA